MREILFRGKWTDNGGWVDGYFTKAGEYCYILTGMLSLRDGHVEFAKYRVDPETVGQYTGLKDKNGVRIFDGDILEDSLKQELYTVNIGEYNQCDTCFDDEEKAAYGCYTVDSNEFEESIGHAHIWATVIGNIHDNPELLKEGGE